MITKLCTSAPQKKFRAHLVVTCRIINPLADEESAWNMELPSNSTLDNEATLVDEESMIVLDVDPSWLPEAFISAGHSDHTLLPGSQ